MKNLNSFEKEHKYAMLVLTIELFVNFTQLVPTLQGMFK